MAGTDERGAREPRPPGDREESVTSIRRLRRGRRRHPEPFVNLTSMVDVLSVLLFFLLTIYSGGGYLTVLPEGLQLPNSNVTKALQRNVEIAVLKDRILVDRERIADDPAQFLANEELVLPSLQATLVARLPADASGARVTIQADRTIPFRLLKKVMFTVDQAGFHRQSLAVRQVTG